MYMRFTVEIFGGKFFPTKIIDQLNTNLVLFYNLISDSTDDEEGSLFLKAPKEFSNEYYDEEYEEQFVDFFVNNYDLLIENGADDFRIFIDIYYYDQCNFEIFDKVKLKILAKYNVSLPISVYEVEPYNVEDVELS